MVLFSATTRWHDILEVHCIRGRRAISLANSYMSFRACVLSLRLTTRLLPGELPASSFLALQRRNHTVADTGNQAMEAIKSTIAENFGGAAHSLAKPEHHFDIEKDIPDLTDKVAVITGGSEGIGYAAGFMMLKNNLSKLFIISVSKEVIDGALKDISEKLGAEYAKKVVWLECDMGDLPNVAELSKTISESTDRVDILCLNAARGIMTYQLTEDGLDRHMQVNHIGHVTLCSHLMPLLKKTAEKGTVRIQAQSSNAHQGTPSDCKFASIDEMNQDLGPNGQYGRSKLAQALYMRYLAAHLSTSHPNILANATHPGFVETKMSQEDIHGKYSLSLGPCVRLYGRPLLSDYCMKSLSGGKQSRDSSIVLLRGTITAKETLGALCSAVQITLPPYWCLKSSSCFDCLDQPTLFVDPHISAHMLTRDHRTVSNSRIRHERRNKSLQKGSVDGSSQYIIRGNQDRKHRGVHLSPSNSRARQSNDAGCTARRAADESDRPDRERKMGVAERGKGMPSQSVLDVLMLSTGHNSIWY
jgi:NAD(P)-dependent dehydrogenase (short-subunit alcohol dehydrogenase family)